MIHVALGTANSLGLVEGDPLVPPGTAHFMNGGQCVFDCAYCTRARTSTAREEYLCRVPWPPFKEEDVFEALRMNAHKFSRICLQMVNSRGHIETATHNIEGIRSISSLPISVEIRTRKPSDIELLLGEGADYVGLPLDVASEGLYPELRGGSLVDDLAFLLQSAEDFKDRIGTHLIVGLGESETEMVKLMRRILNRQIPLGLFAFTPCRGTRMEKTEPPSLSHYRRIQIAKHLITAERDEKISFDERGRIESFGLDEGRLDGIPSGIFETQGCEGCNRPYYNERPAGRPFNYPRELTEEEFQTELEEAWR
ncbi:MAG: radical SAM protein [Thermoplasmata archaeon]|nr:radical SAM protein [Thermoplasmata archaeon]